MNQHRYRLSETLPHVTAVMVTGKSPERLWLARLSARAFLAQTYPMHLRELLIINDATHPVFPHGPPLSVREWQVARQASLGHLRNLAFETIRNGLLIQWDDDDYCHPSRIEFQVRRLRFLGNILRYEIHCHLKTGTAYIADGRKTRVRGFPGTILHRRDIGHRYPLIERGEDTVFVEVFKKQRQLEVLENEPCLYLRFYHGWNTWDERHVMDKPQRYGRPLSATQASYVSSVLDQYRSVLQTS